MTNSLTPTCFNPAEESAYYYEALAELAEQEALEEQNLVSTNREVEELPIPAWLLDEGHDLEPVEPLEPLEPLEALEVAA